MLLEQAARHPLVDGHSDHLSQGEHSRLLLLEDLSLLDGLEEEGDEGLEGVLIHVVDDAQGDQQEVEHGTLGGDSTIDLTEEVDLDLSVLGDELLSLNLS